MHDSSPFIMLRLFLLPAPLFNEAVKGLFLDWTQHPPKMVLAFTIFGWVFSPFWKSAPLVQHPAGSVVVFFFLFAGNKAEANNGTMQSHAILYDLIRYNAIPYNTMQYHAIPFNAIQYNEILISYDAMQCHAIPYNTLQYIMQYQAIPYGAMLYHAIPYGTMQWVGSVWAQKSWIT